MRAPATQVFDGRKRAAREPAARSESRSATGLWAHVCSRHSATRSLCLAPARQRHGRKHGANRALGHRAGLWSASLFGWSPPTSALGQYEISRSDGRRAQIIALGDNSDACGAYVACLAALCLQPALLVFQLHCHFHFHFISLIPLAFVCGLCSNFTNWISSLHARLHHSTPLQPALVFGQVTLSIALVSRSFGAASLAHSLSRSLAPPLAHTVAARALEPLAPSVRAHTRRPPGA